MRKPNGSILRGIVLSSLTLAAGTAAAEVVDFQGMPSAVYGQANENTVGGLCPTTGGTSCFVENGVVVGIVKDSTDIGSHFHRNGLSADREAQYHPDSTGVYVRKADGTAFSLTSIDVAMLGEEGGNFVIYGYRNAFNPDLLTSDVGTDPDYGSTTPIAVYRFDNAAAASGVLNVAAENTAFNDISAFWIHLEGFPHSPTTNYITTPPPDFDLRLDDITLGAASPVPVPAAAWLFGSGIAGLVARRRRA